MNFRYLLASTAVLVSIPDTNAQANNPSSAHTTPGPAQIFDAIKSSLNFANAAPGAEENIKAIIKRAIEEGATIQQIAYILATVEWETAGTYAPINERGGHEYFMRLYDVTGNNPDLALRLGNTKPGMGAKFHGRGFVQITGFTNYRRMSDVTGINLVKNPDAACEDNIAVEILIVGMMQGLFTGLSLNDFVSKDGFDAVRARAVVNGSDKAKIIATRASQIFSAYAYDNLQ